MEDQRIAAAIRTKLNIPGSVKDGDIISRSKNSTTWAWVRLGLAVDDLKKCLLS